MANSYLTPTAVTRKALMVLHQKCNFLGSINRQYDASYAGSGTGVVRGKFGPDLKIRLPNEYTVRTGMNMAAQEQSEISTTLTVSTVKGVDMYFGSDELALSIDDFSERFIEPAMSVLAANIESDALTAMTKLVYNTYDGDAAAFAVASVTGAKQKLTENLAPQDRRSMLLNPTHANKFLVDTKGLFHDGEAIAKQWRDGTIGRAFGFEFLENTLLVPHTTGTAVKTTTYTINATVTTNGATAVTLTGAATTWKAGDIFTVAACNRVHPETKADTGQLQQFTVLADCTTAMTFNPPIYTSGPRQNVVAAGMVATSAVVKVGAAASETLNQSLAYHRDAFTFVTADLELPKGVDFAAREVMDGISMSVVRDFNVSDRTFPCRIDVLYGYKAIRPQLACRVHNDG